MRVLPALILLFFVASTAINPKTTRAVGGLASPTGASSPTPTPAIVGDLGPAAPAIIGSLNTPSPAPLSPTATALPTATTAPTATPTTAPTTTPTTVPTVASTTAPTATPIPPTATPTGPTATPDQGAVGNAVPVAGTIRVPVLMYHYVRVNPVAGDTVGFGLSVTPKDFAAQMAWLVQSGYHTVLPSELWAALVQGAPLPTKPIVLTFDDGYRDFYDQAWPVLRRFGLKASSAVITADADKGDRGDALYMTWQMIQELDQSGMVEIASHTQFHGDMTRMTAAQRWTELTQSKETIERHLGHACTAFVYPSGQYNSTVVADTRRAGYQIAFTTQGGKVRVAQDAGMALQLPRIRVNGGETLSAFADSIG